MAAPTIPNGEEHFFPIIYEGNGGGQRVGKFVPFTDSGTIANSLIFDAASNVSLTRTPGGAGNRKTFTVSVWAKRCVLTDASGNNTYGQRILNVGASGSAFFDIKWSGSGDTEGANKLHIREYSSSAEQIEYWTNRTFEDTSKWYHILLAVDTTQSTSGDRIKLYVDGNQITSWYRSNAPSQDFDTLVNSTVLHNIGRFTGATTNNLSGYLAEFNLVDGQALTPASFGVTDTSTGRWIPKTVSPYPTTTTNIAVTVVSSGGNKFAVDGVTQGAVTLIEGATYKFDQSDSSNATHPLRFSTTSDGTHNSGTEYTTGVTTAGTPGSSGAYTQITVATGAPTLYYYCSSHSGMGGTANTQDQYGTNGFRLQFLDSTHAGIDTSGNGNTFTASNLIDFESQPIAMGGTAFDTGSAGAWDGSYPVANGFTESTSTQAIYNDGSTAIGGVIGWDFGSGRSANIQHIKINQLAVNNSITGFTFEYSDNGSDYTSVGTFSVTAATSTQTVSVLNTAGKHRYWRLKSTTNTTGGQSSYRWVVAFLGFYSQPVTTDSPTQNFATGTATASSGNVVPHTISEGNLAFSNPSGTSGRGVSTAKSTLRLDPKSDTGYYCEIKCDTTAGGNGVAVGITDVRADGVAPNTSTYTSSIGNNFILATDGYYSRDVNGSNTNATDTSTFPTYTTGDTLGLAFKEGKLWIAKNNTWYNSGNPSTGANPIIQFSNETLYRFALYLYGVNAGSGNKGTFNFGQRAFRYTPPTDFVAVQQDNLPETGKGVSGLSWIKDRDSASYSHFLFDSSRGQGNALKSNSTNGQSSYNPNELQKFLKGGYSVGSSTEVNRATSYAAWNWVANSGSTSSNTEGSITSTVQANTTAGFSIIEATAAASGNFTVGHGLSSPPEFFWLKMTGTAGNWVTYHHSFSTVNGEYILLDSHVAAGTSPNAWGSAIPTSSVIGLGAASSVTASQPFVIHAWHGVDGFSKFGKYEGNNNADGAFVYTGFKPAFVMIKSIDNGSSSYPWAMYDSKRSPNNPVSLFMSANATDVENTLDRIDFLSNGFKCRQAYSYSNAGETYIYMAWAEHPFVGDGTNPVTAR